MTLLQGSGGYPWSNNVTPSPVGQFPGDASFSRNVTMTVPIPKWYNCCAVIYTMIGGGTSGTDTPGAWSVTLHALSQYYSGRFAVFAQTGTKNQTGNAIPFGYGSTQGYPYVYVNRGILYARGTAPTAATFTDNGDKYIAGGASPVINWTGAPAYANQSGDGPVAKYTLTSTPTAPFFFATQSATSLSTSDPDIYIWNFTTSSYTLMTHYVGALLSLSGDIYKTEDYVGPSNEIYIRAVLGGGGGSISANVGFIFGHQNPLD